MTAVNISGTFAKDDRPDNGLEAIAAQLAADELSPRLVVGIVVPHAFKKKVGEPLIPVVRFAAIEAVGEADGVIVRELIDKYRAARRQGAVQESLFVGDYPVVNDPQDPAEEDEDDEEEDEDEADQPA